MATTEANEKTQIRVLGPPLLPRWTTEDISYAYRGKHLQVSLPETVTLMFLMMTDQ
jgi:hypothetical protein